MMMTSRMSGSVADRADNALSPERDGAAIALGSGDPAHFAEITRPEIALVEWWRRPPVVIEADDLFGLEPVKLATEAGDVGRSLRTAIGGDRRRWIEQLALDAQDLATRFAAIMATDRVAVRLEPVDIDACRRFHADNVTVRLLCTYVGPGTEWIIGSVDRAARVHRLGTGHVGMFKGREWARTAPVLHRSPPIAGTDDRRLLLVIDIADVHAAM